MRVRLSAWDSVRRRLRPQGWEGAVLARGPAAVLLADRDGRIRRLPPPAAAALRGRERPQEGSRLAGAVHEDDRAALAAWLSELGQAPADQTMRVEVRLDDPRLRRVTLVGVNLLDDHEVGALAIGVSDAREADRRDREPAPPPSRDPLTDGALLYDRLEREKAALEALAVTDELTGIGNFRRYRQALAALHERACLQGEHYSLAFCDIDSFGDYNKRRGQAEGDRALRTVASAILANLRAGDEVHRRGGEELVVLLPRTDQDTGVRVAERLRRAVEGLDLRRSDDPADGTITVSIGVATLDPDHPVAPTEIERAADRAMVAAKDQGKNRVVGAGDS